MQLDRIPLKTPVGELVALWADTGLIALSWPHRLNHVQRHLRRHLGSYTERPGHEQPILAEALRRYFSGDLDALLTLPIDPPGTDFQQEAWSALQVIPAGQTWSYAQQAKHIGQPTATRAIAQANGANPIPLVVPCHRVVAADGGLGGFSSGLQHKRWLLAHEGAAETRGQVGLFEGQQP